MLLWGCFSRNKSCLNGNEALEAMSAPAPEFVLLLGFLLLLFMRFGDTWVVQGHKMNAGN